MKPIITLYFIVICCFGFSLCLLNNLKTKATLTKNEILSTNKLTKELKSNINSFSLSLTKQASYANGNCFTKVGHNVYDFNNMPQFTVNSGANPIQFNLCNSISSCATGNSGLAVDTTNCISFTGPSNIDKAWVLKCKKKL